MEQAVFPPRSCQLSLRSILSVHDQPVCEEQAWALCYQLCSLLERNFSLNDGQTYGSWKGFRLPGPEGIFLSSDGNISLRIEHGKVGKMSRFPRSLGELGRFASCLKHSGLAVWLFLIQTVDYVGRLMYSCLDWGLGADVERELDETLELLVDQMTKVDLRLGAERSLQTICTISEVLQVCEERLYNPSQATQHYRSVCATLYSHTVELCNYLQIIQHTQENLQKLIVESENSLVPDMTTNWGFTWKHLIDELSRGVVLHPPRDKVNTGVPLPSVDTSPFSQLLQDIQLRRYTLRKVKVMLQRCGVFGFLWGGFYFSLITLCTQWKYLNEYCCCVKVLENGGTERGADPYQALLDVIRSGPKLRPVSFWTFFFFFLMVYPLFLKCLPVAQVSERKLKPRVQNQKHEVSLHELLMQEIRSTDPVKLLSSCQRRRPRKGPVVRVCVSVPISVSHAAFDSSAGSSVRNLSFFPALSSTPLSLSEGCRLSRGKRRAQSLPSNPEVRQLVSEEPSTCGVFFVFCFFCFFKEDFKIVDCGVFLFCFVFFGKALKNKVSVPTTIADVIKTHYRKEGKLSCDPYGNWRICSCCAKRSLYFTWHNFCSLCNRVVCPECCLELRLPFKWCINLPISFFKKIVLKKESEESQRLFWNERWSWDPSRVPLVLASSRVSGSVAPHALAMRDWHNQDMCVGCQGLLLEACDSPAPPFTIKAPQEI
ncbi:protein spire homolog 1 [Ictalurus furcatus]|uniref:protein spire homolog 1 n=1 Tax=Ictalurus furcatus TaxID=66913 RepID=UPI002350717A|nr:protein spire homolog 1 [Ictalurus furcatus]